MIRNSIGHLEFENFEMQSRVLG